MSDVPPTLSLSEVTKPRYRNVVNKFLTTYSGKPDFFCRAPGRVNLIGEHIDYCGYAVLPIAIEQDMVIAARCNDSNLIKISNTNPDDYGSYTCNAAEVSIDNRDPKWYQYFLCGFTGIVEHCKLTTPVGMDIMVDGSVPPNAGLSSSSALVCCAAMATAKCNNKTVSKHEFAELCQSCERYIGTEGGGMDQAISFLAEPGTAKLIEFNPVHATEVNLPEGGVFVVSNSCKEMNKAATAHFNARVAECRLASQVLAKKKRLEWKRVRRLGDLQKALKMDLDGMIELIKEELHEEPYTRKEICEILEASNHELNAYSLNERTHAVESFKLLQRAEHVYTEAGRVYKFKSVCGEGPDDALTQLGQLMNESHSSCSKLYECSCDELDNLTQICRESGALGSRLTGAGWGGCAVSLVPQEHLETFLQAVAEKYYELLPDFNKPINEVLFATKPGGGAVYFNAN